MPRQGSAIPVLLLADFSPDYRGEAHAYKNGVVRGIELARQHVQVVLQAEARSERSKK